MLAGQIIIDKYGGIWFKRGANVVRVTAMTVFDKMLVFGIGEQGTHSTPNYTYPNIVYADFDKITEACNYNSGTATYNNKPVRSVWCSRVYGDEAPSRKRLTRFHVFYFTSKEHTAGTIGIEYRIDDYDWATLHSFTTECDDRVHFINEDRELEKEGKLWQFRVVSNVEMCIIGFDVWLRPEPLTQD
jgi:hypothetical protein